ncbi:MAG: arsenate reductase family protein [Terrisporobacter sp.]|uniref:arsenate reductase family protein n=1 Tax=Terrisporobacter sp. TaxID=1965305 RepID=UPI0025CF13E6|nr:arsenate reductase family protein [uncultured Terrisporobacter sp.]
MKFYGYKKCSTANKAKKWLKENNFDFEEIDLIDSPPTKEEMKKIYEDSKYELKKFFNTSGVKYRELGLKEVLKTATEEEMLELLASDGKLIKRPLLVTENKVLIGFKENEYKENLL